MSDAQFQYWVAITFGVLVAGYAAAGRLSVRLRDDTVNSGNWPVASDQNRGLRASRFASSGLYARVVCDVARLLGLEHLAREGSGRKIDLTFTPCALSSGNA